MRHGDAMNQVESSQDTATNKDNEVKDAAQLKREFNKRRLLNAVQPTSGGYTRAREYHRKIDFPLQRCDFQKWTRHDSLPIERACFIMLGYEPPPLAWLRFEPQPFQSAPAPTWEEPPGYRDVLDSLRTSIARGTVSTMRITEFPYETEHIGWQELALWMRAKKYEISSGFEEAVATMGPVALMALAQSSDPIKRATLAPADTVAPVTETEAALVRSGVAKATDWKDKAQVLAWEIIAERKTKDLYPSQENLGDEIAARFREDGIVGTAGKPLKGAYIKRRALKGISSEQGKQLSTSIRQGK